MNQKLSKHLKMYLLEADLEIRCCQYKHVWDISRVINNDGDDIGEGIYVCVGWDDNILVNGHYQYRTTLTYNKVHKTRNLFYQV